MGVANGVREGDRAWLGVEQKETGGCWVAGVRGGSSEDGKFLDTMISKSTTKNRNIIYTPISHINQAAYRKLAVISPMKFTLKALLLFSIRVAKKSNTAKLQQALKC